MSYQAWFMFACLALGSWCALILLDRISGYLRDIRDELQAIRTDTTDISKRC